MYLSETSGCINGQGKKLGAGSGYCFKCPRHAYGVGGYCYECAGGKLAMTDGQTSCTEECKAGEYRTRNARI